MSYPQVPSDLDHLHFHRINSRKCYVYEDRGMQILKSYNTIVAMYDKDNQILYRDEVPYSSFTSVHVGVFLFKYPGYRYKETIYIPQNYLINFIRLKLKGKSPCIQKAFKFTNGMYAKLYRIHHVENRLVKIVNHSDSYSFLYGNETTRCTVVPLSYDVCSSNQNDETFSSYKPKNLIPLECGL